MDDYNKGQGSSIYTILGVLLVAVFSLFLFVTQTGNKTESVRTTINTEVSLDSQLRMRNLHTNSFPAPKIDNMKITTMLSYSCEYGNSGNSYSFRISDPEDSRALGESFLERYLNQTFRHENYRLMVKCDRTGRNITVGSDIPENPELVISNTMMIPLAAGNRTEVTIQQW